MKSSRFLCAWLFLVLAPLAVAEDPDFGNDLATAQTIPADGTFVNGVLGSGDVDWFKYTPAANTLYRVTLIGEIDKGYKEMDIYQIDEFGSLHKTIYQLVWSNSVSVRTFFLEKGDDIYVKLFSNVGGYSFSIETLGQYPPDSYSDSCAEATAITVDASPMTGTLTHTPDGGLETDWFVFDTQPLHMYEIKLTKCDNTDLNFQVYNANCEIVLNWSKNHTVTSWFGEKYKIYVAGNPAHLGTYYTLEVVDLGLYPDDYSNVSQTANPIAADGSMVEGRIQFNSSYHSDEDWFKFTPNAKTLYKVTLNGEINSGYKEMDIYQIDEFGNLHKTIYSYTWSDSVSVKTFFLEKGDDVYVKLFSNGGGYSYYIESLGQYLPDSYSDTCAEATAITVDASPMIGTLTHNPDSSLETDWFVFDTQPLHMYEIKLTKCDNTDLNFQMYNANCEIVLNWSKNHTVTSWFGERYKIYVAGNPAHLGTYYTLEVVDLGLYPDDYSNIPATAANIPKDGSLVKGEIQFISSYHSDEDWMTFIAGRAGDYQFSLTGEVNKGYKEIRIYWKDELEVLREYKYSYVWSDAVSNFSATLPAGKIYVQMYSNLGGYTLSVVSPEPRCGDLDHPYPPGDANKDCTVNLADLALMAANWLSCTSPNPPCNFKP
jgi:hypothetical protein